MNIILALLLQVVLIALNAVFACAEIAIISINEAKLEKMAEEGNKKAKKLLKLKSDPAKFLATIQVAITLAGFLGSAFAAENFSDPIVNLLLKAGIATAATAELFETAAVIVITLILSYFTLIFGELVPKRVAMKKTESIALGLAGFLTAISKFFRLIERILLQVNPWCIDMCGNDGSTLFDRVRPNDRKHQAFATIVIIHTVARLECHSTHIRNKSCRFCEFHGFIHDSALRNRIHFFYLINSHAQDPADSRFHFLYGYI